MKVLTKLLLTVIILTLTTFCFCENNTEEQEVMESVVVENDIKIIDRENYQVQIKQYDKDYPIVLYVVFRESTPLINEIRKILREELLIFAKTEIEPALQDSLKKEEEEKQKEKDSKNKKENKQNRKESKTNKEEEQNKIEKKIGLETIRSVVIASAWFDDNISESLEKIELTKKYGAFVWLYDEIDKDNIFTFEEYLKYLKNKKEIFKKKEKLEKSEDMQ